MAAPAPRPGVIRAQRVLSAMRKSSSSPVLVETEAGTYFEASPREAGDFVEKHLFRVSPTELKGWDEPMAAALPRAALEQAVNEVPDDFLRPLLPASAGSAELLREREAYVAFLWKRLKAPRPFVMEP